MTISEIISIHELFPNSTSQLIKPFEKVINPDIHTGMCLDFKLCDRGKRQKINPILRLARPEDAEEIVQIYKELYNGTYPYKEMEDVAEVRRMIQDPSVQWIIYQDPSFNLAGCITFVLDFENKRGYIRGFMLKKKYQGIIDITKAMIGSMLGMIYNFKDRIYNWYVENRTAHAKSQYSMWVCGIAPIGFYPNKDIFMGKVESDLMQILYDERTLTQYRSKKTPQILPCVETCYLYSEARYHLGAYKFVSPELTLDGEKIKGLRRDLVKHISKDKYGYETIRYELGNSYFEFLYTPQVQNFEKTKYFVNNLEEIYVFTREFIDCGKKLGIRYCEAFISAYEPEHQQIFYEAGLVPRGYIPSWNFNPETETFEDYILFNSFAGTIDKEIQVIDEGEELLNALELQPQVYTVEQRPRVLQLLRDVSIKPIGKVVKKGLGLGIIGYVLLIILSGIVAFFTGPTSYLLWQHTISDLGSSLITPYPGLFDTACIMAGMITIPYYFSLRKKISIEITGYEKSITITSPFLSHILLKLGVILGALGGIGYFLVGVFSLERAGPHDILHGFCAGGAFLGFVCSIIFFSIYILIFQNKIPRLIGLYGIFAPLIFLGLYCVFLIPLFEWLLLISILSFSVPLGLWVFLK